MVDGSAIHYCDSEIQRNSYNAAFHELGFRFHWDSDTYRQLLGLSTDAAERISHYLKTRQAHLLRAYELEALVALIGQKKSEHHQRGTATGGIISRHFNWAEASGCELGA